MIIHKLEVEGFGIIGNKISLNFPEQGKIGIFGFNESGKSTLFRAIEFTLFGLMRNPPPNYAKENLVTWDKQQAKVALEFSSGKRCYRVERTIGVDGDHEVCLYEVSSGRAELRENRIKEVETAIQEITGMDRNAFTKLIYIKQKELDALKGLGSSKREELFNKLMGMPEFDQADKAIAEDLRRLQREQKPALEESVKNLQKNVEKLKSRRAEKEKLDEELKDLERRKQAQEECLKLKEKQFKAYKWLREWQSVKSLLDEKARNLQNLKEKEDNKAQLEADIEESYREIKCYEQLKEKHEEDYKRLKALEDQIALLQADSEKAQRGSWQVLRKRKQRSNATFGYQLRLVQLGLRR